MFEKKLIEEVLGVAMSSGADFAEIFAERTRNNAIRFVDKKIDRINDNFLSGVGIRIFSGTRTIYASTTDISRNGLIACARSVAEALGETKGILSLCLTPRASFLFALHQRALPTFTR